MAGGDYNNFQGLGQSTTTPTGSTDLLYDIHFGPPEFEAVVIHEEARDRSAAALVLDANGYKLMKGLIMYQSSSGYWSPCGLMSGNSPGISPSGDTHERPKGLLAEDIPMLDPQTGVTVKRPGVICTVGAIDYTKVHDMYGNFLNYWAMLTDPAHPKWSGCIFKFSQNRFSAGHVSP